jgi:hypothetical protein
MKPELMRFTIALGVALGQSGLTRVSALDTTFIYQGRLTEAGTPYTGEAEFQPTLWDAATGGMAVAVNNPATLAVGITNGLLVLPLDFGAPFSGADRWLQLSVRTTLGDFMPLVPRQKITAAPYAQTANKVAGMIDSAQVGGVYGNAVTFNNAANSFSGSGAGLTGLNASQLTAGTVPEERMGAGIARTSQVWQLGGNAGTASDTDFLGTTDRQPLVLRSGNREVLRLVGTAEGVRLVGGVNNSIHATSTNSVILGGHNNTIATNAPDAVIVGGRYNDIRTDQRSAFIGGGGVNTIGVDNQYAVIVGGRNNRIGTNCLISAILGGAENVIRDNVDHGLIGGGYYNEIQGSSDPEERQIGPAILSGGRNYIMNSSYATIAGGRQNHIGTNSANAFVGGGGYGLLGYTITGNNIRDNCGFATIVGGGSHRIWDNSPFASIGGGYHVDIKTNSPYATVAGGHNNNIGDNSPYASILGGADNDVSTNCLCSTIAGGTNNSIGVFSDSSTIAGGAQNVISNSCDYSGIGGGRGNLIFASSAYATIPGGRDNAASDYAFAAGRRAKASHNGAFVWGDATDADIESGAANQFTVRASGGVRFFSNTAATSGVKLDRGDNSWSSVSDQDLKKDRTPADVRQVLERLVSVPVDHWRYRWEDSDSLRHLGPMAQDFKAAFYPGRDDRSISTMEFDGVALAAIQGLNRKLEEKTAALEKEVAELKVLVRQLSGKVTDRESPPPRAQGWPNGIRSEWLLVTGSSALKHTLTDRPRSLRRCAPGPNERRTTVREGKYGPPPRSASGRPRPLGPR